MPKLSIIVPVYNVEKYLDDCLNSILQQTYSDWELILVDDGSNDASGAICDSYAATENRITVIHTENRGQSHARNLALDIAKGEYITFIDADDYLGDINTHEYAINVLEQNPQVDIVTYPHIGIDSNGFLSKETLQVFNSHASPVILSDKSYLITHLDVIKSMQPCYIVSTPWAKIFRRNIWINHRYPEGMIFEDAYVLCNIIEDCNSIAFINSGEYYYRYNPNSSLHQKKTPERFFFRIKLLLHFNESLNKLSGANCIDSIIYYIVQGKRHWKHQINIRKECKILDSFIKNNANKLNGISVKLAIYIGTYNMVLLKIISSFLLRKPIDLTDF